MSDDTPKQTADFSDEVAAKIPEYCNPARKNAAALPDALDNLLALEKKTRLAADFSSTRKVAVAILELIHACNEWKVFNDHIRLICKRRAQLKQVIQAVVELGFSFISKTPNDNVKLDLIHALREVSEGKIFVELEGARLTRILSEMKEKEGKIDEAADLLQEVQIEIMGTMEKQEKAMFLMDQIRLTLAKGDFVRVGIIANKVNTNILHEDESFHDLKLKFYNLMIQYHHHSANYLEICKAYRCLLNTPSIQNDPKQWQPILRSIVVYLLLSAHNDEQRSILDDLTKERKLDDVPDAQSAIKMIRLSEIIARPIPQEKAWASTYFSGEDGSKRLHILNKRIVQHNIRVISKYYSRIRSERLAALLQLTVDETEEYISEMVSDNALYSKIDRPLGIVSFSRRRDANEVLNEWSSDISSLLSLVEQTCHKIDKENMMHGI